MTTYDITSQTQVADPVIVRIAMRHSFDSSSWLLRRACRTALADEMRTCLEGRTVPRDVDNPSATLEVVWYTSDDRTTYPQMLSKTVKVVTRSGVFTPRSASALRVAERVVLLRDQEPIRFPHQQFLQKIPRNSPRVELWLRIKPGGSVVERPERR